MSIDIATVKSRSGVNKVLAIENGTIRYTGYG